MLLTYYDQRNRVIREGLLQNFNQECVRGSWSSIEGLKRNTYDKMFKYIRKAHKAYSYVGMDYVTAVACAEAMVQKYTRTTRLSEWCYDDEHNDEWFEVAGGSKIMASVEIKHVGGEMYDVDITVNEHDERMRKQPSSLISYLFSDCLNRDYDGEEL